MNRESSDSGLPRKDGFTLSEMMVTLFILVLLALGFTKTLTFTKFTAEDNLYEATALATAVSTIEQMMGSAIGDLKDPPKVDGKEVFYFKTGPDTEVALALGEKNLLNITLDTDSQGNTGKVLELILSPTITPSIESAGYWLEVQYAYSHPKTGRIRIETVRNMRSEVASF